MTLPQALSQNPPLTPSDPSGRYVYGRQILHLTDRLRDSSYADAAAFIDQMTEPFDGLLERLADFFEAAGEKAKNSDHDEGFDLSASFEYAATAVREVAEDLASAAEQTRALGPQARPGRVNAQVLGQNLPRPAESAPPGRIR